MSTDPQDAEKASRILALAQTLHKAAEAMEDSNWLQVKKLAAEASRQAGVLLLMERSTEQGPANQEQ